MFIDKTENNDFVQIDEYVKSLDKFSQENATNGNDFLELYEQLRENYKHDLKIYSEYLRQKVDECKILLQRGSDIEIYDTDCDICSVSLSEAPRLNTASFSPNRNPHSCFKEAFGNHYTSNQGQTSSGHEVNVESLEVEIGPSPRQQRSDSEVKTTPSQQQAKEEEVVSQGYTLLPQTKILGEWDSPRKIICIYPTTDGRAWTCSSRSDTLTLLDRKGKIIQEVKNNTLINIISLSPTTNRLWACDLGRNIQEMESGQLKTRFTIKADPLSICITASEHVIIGMDNKISKFTTSGELLQTTEEEGFVKGAWIISECPLTHNIAVVDFRLDVVIYDNNLQELFVYTGQIPDVYTPTTGDKSFDPVAMVYDGMGNLVIGCGSNKRLLLISGRGQFIRIIHTDDQLLEAAGIDRQGVLWSVFYLDHVKLLQYNDMYEDDNGIYQDDNDMYEDDNDMHQDDNDMYEDDNDVHQDDNDMYQDDNDVHQEDNDTHQDDNDVHQEDNDTHQHDNDVHQEDNDKNRCCVLL